MTTEAPAMDLKAIKAAAREALQRRFSDMENWDQDALTRVNRIRIPVRDLPAMEWLSSQTLTPKIYWANRNHEFRMAGVGSIHTLAGSDPAEISGLLPAMRPQLTDRHPHLRYYGGFQFDPVQPADREWEDFGAYTFTIPEFELFRTPSTTYFAWNFRYGSGDQDGMDALLERLEEIQFDLVLPEWEQHVELLRHDNPERLDWIETVKRALALIQKGNLDKIVLARRASLDFASAIDPVALMLQLRMMSEDTFNYIFQPTPHRAFLGASPERLFRRQGRQLSTEAIAGTRVRGRTRREDERLESELLASAKELREHGYVVRAIENILSDLSQRVDSDPDVSVTKLAHVQHLCRHFSAELNPEIDDTGILRALHPTPAIGGSPRDPALDAIRDAESFSRGWYSGAVGYFGWDTAEFAVAIRSALVEDSRATLYSGAGIVEGSDPELEWQEIEDKICKFLKALEH